MTAGPLRKITRRARAAGGVCKRLTLECGHVVVRSASQTDAPRARCRECLTVPSPGGLAPRTSPVDEAFSLACMALDALEAGLPRTRVRELLHGIQRALRQVKRP